MIKFEIVNNPYQLDIDDLISVGKRVNNQKRNFLFISKVLGKHLEVKPDIVKCTGRLLLSTKYNFDSTNLITYLQNQNINIKEELTDLISEDKKTLVIGFAETATGLGMSLAASIPNCTYVTTTRETIFDKNTVFTFEEEHSHATTHKLYYSDFDKFDQIFLVDDEITTGKSMLNIIKAINQVSNIKEFSIFSLLDWRNSDDKKGYEELQEKLNISIHNYSLISGTICEETKETLPEDKETELTEEEKERYDFKILERENNYWENSGKFGVEQREIQKLEKSCEEIAEKIEEILRKENLKLEDKILILGHGENIYIPSRIASYLPYDTYFKTTTRSPICCDGEIIKDRNYFYDKGVKYYFYNKEEVEKKYKKIIMIAEGDCEIKLCENMILVKV